MERLTNERFAEIIRDKELCEFCEDCGNDEVCLNCEKVNPATVGELRSFWKKLTALVKAWDEGRVTISPPPAKEGDPKPDCFYDDGASLWCLGLSHEGDDEPVDRCKQCWYCESGDYADDRAEAEAALGGGGDG